MGGQPVWQREKDSNPHIRSQSPLCYLYTIPLNACAIILFFWTLSRAFSIFQEKFFCFQKAHREAAMIKFCLFLGGLLLYLLKKIIISKRAFFISLLMFF